MEPRYSNNNVQAPCPDCGGVITSFEHAAGSGKFGSVVLRWEHRYEGHLCDQIHYVLMRCAGCGRGGLAEIHYLGKVDLGFLGSFFPFCTEHAKIPEGIPDGIVAEYREAELCASLGARRAASGLLRSTLEKTLRANGYLSGSLEKKIDEAASDGVITEARRKRAHEDIRVLGNDVLHDEWREVSKEEVEVAHHYIQRILEDLYADRPTVEVVLKAKGKICPQP